MNYEQRDTKVFSEAGDVKVKLPMIYKRIHEMLNKIVSHVIYA